MNAILFLLIVALFLICVVQSGHIARITKRLTNIENEVDGRLGMIDDQISDLGGSVIVMERTLDTGRNQGIRAVNHDYNGKPLSSFVAAIIPERFRRSGEMYVGNPNKVVIPPAATSADFRYSQAQAAIGNAPIVPQPFADGEPYRDYADEEAEVDVDRP